MDSTDKSPELAVAAADGANTGSTRSIGLSLDMNLPADAGDDGMEMDAVEAEDGGDGSSSQRRYARISQEQIDQLEATFQQNYAPDRKTKAELAHRIGVPLNKVHIWFRSRRARFNTIKRDVDYKQEVNKLAHEIKTLSERNSSLTAQHITLTEKIFSLTEKVSSLAEKGISLSEQNSSLIEEKRRLEGELAETKAAPVPPLMMVPVPGLPQVFIELCRVCSPIFRDTAAAAAGALLPGSRQGSTGASASSSASTSASKLCPGCRSTLENMEAMVASFAQQQQGGSA